MENFETFRLDQTGQQTQAILDQVSTNTADIEQLRALYEALTQNEPVIIQPSDTWPVADPQENVIYRVIDRVNTPPQSYSDYMWNGMAMVLMATYNNPIDNEPTPGSNNLVKSGGVAASIVFDISAYHATGSTLATYANLAAALGTDGANVPASVRKGGMSIKFVQSSDNKYVQYRLMADDWSTTITDWQGVDDVPTAGSDNLVKSGGVFTQIGNSVEIVGGILQNKDGLQQILVTDGVTDKILSSTTGLPELSYSGFNTSSFIDLNPKSNLYVFYIGNASFGNSSMAVLVIYDADENPLFIVNADASNSLIQYGKYIVLDLPFKAKKIRFSYYHTESRRPSFYSLSKELYEVNPDMSISVTKRLDDLTKLSDSVSETDTIFGKAAQGYITTDYIAVTDNHYRGYFAYLGAFSSAYTVMAYYDANHNLLKAVRGDYVPNNMLAKLQLPKGTAYIRYAKIAGNTVRGIYLEDEKSFETIINQMIDKKTNIYFTENNNILWLGTSIPEGAQYPAKASEKCGYNCTNNAYGSSQLCWSGQRPATVNEYSGRCLTATVAELEAMFRQDVTAGTITEATLELWKNKSYERSLLPYINGTNETQVSMIVLDHGFNDRVNIHSIMQNPNAIDWTSRDRSNFVGAFNYLMDRIQEIKPTIKIVISGYFQNTITFSDYYSKDICDMQALIAEHYSIAIMKAWEHTQINNSYVAGSSNYLQEFNTRYGTSYAKWNPDGNGNITAMQIYCPDRVHPHSDLTGNCDKRLNAVYSKLLADSI